MIIEYDNKNKSVIFQYKLVPPQLCVVVYE